MSRRSTAGATDFLSAPLRSLQAVESCGERERSKSAQQWRSQSRAECRGPRCVGLGIVTRLLLADDDPSTLEFLRLALSARDVEIREATSGAELVSLLASDGPYDLVVTDVAMSWMSGLQAIAAVRTAGLSTPALVVTGLSDPSLAERVSRLGRVGLLHKPVGVEELLGAIDALLVGARTAS
jgi:CheY-like chemotaxis protein